MKKSKFSKALKNIKKKIVEKKAKFPGISDEVKEYMKEKKLKVRVITSFLPIDKYECDCFGLVKNWQDKFSRMSPQRIELEKERIGIINCPRIKEKGMVKYEVVCANCGEVVAIVWSKDKELNDWCNLHYICKNDRNRWYGCRAVNISPLDGKLGFECQCGQDTRDFRTTRNKSKIYQEKKIENMKGRDFGKKDSKFFLRKAK